MIRSKSFTSQQNKKLYTKYEDFYWITSSLLYLLGGGKQSGWKVFGISLVVIAISLIYSLLFIVLNK